MHVNSLYFTTKHVGTAAGNAVPVKFTAANCKRVVKSTESREIPVSIGCVVHVTEMIKFLLHLMLEFAYTESLFELYFTTSVLEKLQYELQD